MSRSDGAETSKQRESEGSARFGNAFLKTIPSSRRPVRAS